MSEVLTVFRRFKDFSGRSRRREYWIFLLISNLVLLGLNGLDAVLSLDFGTPEAEVGPFALVYTLFAFIPLLAVNIRRLHDIGRSGWWLLLVFVPFIGALLLLGFYTREGEPSANKWGPNPKEAMPARGGAWG